MIISFIGLFFLNELNHYNLIVKLSAVFLTIERKQCNLHSRELLTISPSLSVSLLPSWPFSQYFMLNRYHCDHARAVIYNL